MCIVDPCIVHFLLDRLLFDLGINVSEVLADALNRRVRCHFEGLLVVAALEVEVHSVHGKALSRWSEAAPCMRLVVAGTRRIA